MDNEKMYKDALERAKKMMDSKRGVVIRKEAIKAIFPELAESEDERIRKAIIELLKEVGQDDTGISENAKCMIAWLEKQKYDRMQPVYDNLDSFESALAKAWKAYNDSGSRTVDGCEDDYVECAHAKGFREGYLFGLEKQKEQKPELPLMGGDTDTYFDDLRITTKSLTSREWFNEGIKYAQRLQKEQHPSPRFLPGAWLVYDGPLGHAILQVKDVVDGRYTFVDNDSTLLEEDSDKFLRPLTPKDVEKKVEWSEEDERIRKAILGFLNPDKGGTKYSSNAELVEWSDWLKSLRPSWKPSEDEERLINTSISFLKDFADKGYENAVECIDWLKSKLNGNTCE